METAREILSGYVSDMLLIEREIHAAVRRQRDSSSAREMPAAQGLLSRLEEQLDQHVAALKVALDRGGGGEPTLKSTLGAILGAAAGLFDRIRLDAQLSRMLRDDYAALSFASVCYEMLHTTALGVRDQWVADLAIRHLGDYARCIMEIGDTMPQVLLAELHAQGTATVDPGVALQAQRNVRAAWSSQSPEVSAH